MKRHFTKKYLWMGKRNVAKCRGDEDGGLGGWGAHLSPWTHQKYIYLWSNCHWQLTGHWQKDSCTTKTVRKIHKELSRKGREVIRLGPVPLRGDSEEKGDYMSRDPPWRVSGVSHILGDTALGTNTGETSSLAGWRANGTNRRAVKRLDFICKKHEHARSWSRTDRWFVNCMGG